MAITKDDIKKLAELARIEMSDAEAENFAPEIDSILGYVGQIKDATGDIEKKVPSLHNVLRDDEVTNQSGQYTEEILDLAPTREGQYIKVKKIL